MIGSVKPPLELKKRQLSSIQQQLPNFSLGDQGEKSAFRFLTAKGYQILDTNVRVGNNEVDLVAVDPRYNEIVFCEVKTRAKGIFGDPSEAVNYSKLKSMRKVASFYIRKHRLTQDYRFDIISIVPHQIQHFENITWFG